MEREMNQNVAVFKSNKEIDEEVNRIITEGEVEKIIDQVLSRKFTRGCLCGCSRRIVYGLNNKHPFASVLGIRVFFADQACKRRVQKEVENVKKSNHPRDHLRQRLAETFIF